MNTTLSGFMFEVVELRAEVLRLQEVVEQLQRDLATPRPPIDIHACRCVTNAVGSQYVNSGGKAI